MQESIDHRESPDLAELGDTGGISSNSAINQQAMLERCFERQASCSRSPERKKMRLDEPEEQLGLQVQRVNEYNDILGTHVLESRELLEINTTPHEVHAEMEHFRGEEMDQPCQSLNTTEALTACLTREPSFSTDPQNLSLEEWLKLQDISTSNAPGDPTTYPSTDPVATAPDDLSSSFGFTPHLAHGRRPCQPSLGSPFQYNASRQQGRSLSTEVENVTFRQKDTATEGIAVSPYSLLERVSFVQAGANEFKTLDSTVFSEWFPNGDLSCVSG